jgi:hypothetical protein
MHSWCIFDIYRVLLVYIDHVHIRYEDDQSNVQHPYAFGITLEHIHAETTDEFWAPAFVKDDSKMIFKVGGTSKPLPTRARVVW